jgi:PKD repeat protein
VARIQAGRLARRISRPGLTALAVLSALLAGPVATATAATATAATDSAQAAPSASVTTALTRAFETAQHIPGSAVGGIRAGSEHVGAASGTEWAIATFVPSARAGQQLAARFQDGAGTGVFTERAGGTWRLVRTGPYGCGAGLPAALAGDWGLARPASCSATAGTTAAQRAAAQRALAAHPSGTHASAASTSAASTSLGQSIANIALSQVGVSDTPVVTSFGGVDCDPYSTLVAGFSANSDGCGYDTGFNVENENETWCSDFSKWVWEQAGVTAELNTLNAGSVSFYAWGLSQGQSLAPDEGTPQVGDAIVFFGPGTVSANSYADHVGIVSAVNADGTINMVNGDFLGTSNISVQYDTNISLTNWAASVWGPGEQWVIVAPPSSAQQPAPSATISGPRVAVTGTTGTFRAQGIEPGGSISEYYWTFGDGRTTNTTGADVTHAFSENGRYTVTVTVTSNSGTATTRTWNVDVLGASSAVAAVPSDAVWFASTPVDEYLFTRAAGGLAAQAWDGSSWLELGVPGQPSASGGLTALSYPDPAAADAMTPHAYFRSADGTLAQTYLNGTAWVTQALAGQPAAGSAIVATTTASGAPAVFYADAAGHLAESVQQASGWTARTLPGVPGARTGQLALADTTAGPRIFSDGPAGTLTVTSPAGAGWLAAPLPALAAPGSPLAAVTTPAGQARVFFTDRRGRLAEVTQLPGGGWLTGELPGTPAGSLAVTNYLLPNGPAGSLGEEVFFRTASGQPEADYDAGQGWQTAALPGTAAGVVGASAYQVAGQPSQVFLSAGNGALTEDSTGGASADPSGTWTSAPLPEVPATFADRVVLYAATAADDTSALAAAAAAGLPASQVTQSYATAWDDTLSGDYLVISVGLAATDALYFNACGWPNPSGDIPGSTPFSIAGAPLDQLPGAGAFEEAAAATAAQAQQRVTDLAYYATHGALPSGVTSLPAAAAPQYACSGSPS